MNKENHNEVPNLDRGNIENIEILKSEETSLQLDLSSHETNEANQLLNIPEQKPGRYREVKETSYKAKFRSFVSLVAAGVVGSVITLTVAPHTGLYNDKSTEPESIPSVTASSNIIATPTSATSGNLSIADVVDHASKAIVGIVNKQMQDNYFSRRSSDSVESGTGSGVIFQKTKDSAYIVTNNHVIEGANEIEVSLYNGEKVTATLVGADALTDLAVLKIDPTHVDSVIEFGDSSKLRPGDQVLAIGNPLGLDLSRTVTQGIVSAINRNIAVSTSAGEWELNVIQTDAAINPGNSGGALINTSGQVIGINSLKVSNSGVEGLGFAIPSNDLIPIINQMIENGKVERPYMGVTLASLNEIPQMYLPNLPKTVQEGAMITDIDPSSAAAKAGLQRQDVIISINNQPIKVSGDIRKVLYTNLKVGDEVTVKFYRNGELTSVNLILSSNQNN